MKVLLMGALNLDHYVIVDNFPAEDSMVFAGSHFYSPGGSGANIAVNLSVLGNNVDFFCGSGDDDNGARLVSALKSNKVEVVCDVQKGSSAEALIIVDRNGKRRIISFGGNALYNAVPKPYPDADCLCIVDSFPEKAAEFAGRYKRAVKVYVPGGCGLYFGVESIRKVARVMDVTILSEPEALEIGSCHVDLSPLVIVTKGSGATSWFMEGRENIVPVEKVSGKIIDTTGAGDAFASGFIDQYMKNRNVASGIEAGHRTAAKVILQYGANLGSNK